MFLVFVFYSIVSYLRRMFNQKDEKMKESIMLKAKEQVFTHKIAMLMLIVPSTKVKLVLSAEGFLEIEYNSAHYELPICRCYLHLTDSDLVVYYASELIAIWFYLPLRKEAPGQQRGLFHPSAL